jgi:VanZ family protein
VLQASLLVMGYGGLDEYHQSFVPGRTPVILDLAADTGGGLLSALLVMILLRRHACR